MITGFYNVIPLLEKIFQLYERCEFTRRKKTLALHPKVPRNGWGRVEARDMHMSILLPQALHRHGRQVGSVK